MCLAVADQRHRQAERLTQRGAEFDQRSYSSSPARRSSVIASLSGQRGIRIAEQAFQKYSRRVGRSAAANRLDPETMRLATIATYAIESRIMIGRCFAFPKTNFKLEDLYPCMQMI